MAPDTEMHVSETGSSEMVAPFGLNVTDGRMRLSNKMIYCGYCLICRKLEIEVKVKYIV